MTTLQQPSTLLEFGEQGKLTNDGKEGQDN